MDKTKNLGQILKDARELKKFTLRTVEDATEVSNAYLSQLENGKIKTPSANILHKLANIYNMDFGFLLSVAGIVEKNEENKTSFGQYVFSKDNLTNEEENELVKYLKFLRLKENNKL